MDDLVENETRFYSKSARVLRLLNYTVVINNSEGSGHVTQSVKVSQQKGEGCDKLTEQFVGPYKIKAIISSNVVELELLATVNVTLANRLS